jgi:hypothetical protein
LGQRARAALISNIRDPKIKTKIGMSAQENKNIINLGGHAKNIFLLKK